MKELLRETLVYKRFASDASAGRQPQSVLVLFPDAAHLRALLKECAKAFFGAEEGSRTALLIDKESFPDCLFFPAAGAKLTVDDAARILEESLLRPVEGGKKPVCPRRLPYGGRARAEQAIKSARRAVPRA